MKYKPYHINNVKCLNASEQKYLDWSRTSYLCVLPSSSHLCVALRIPLRHRLRNSFSIQLCFSGFSGSSLTGNSTLPFDPVLNLDCEGLATCMVLGLSKNCNSLKVSVISSIELGVGDGSAMPTTGSSS